VLNGRVLKGEEILQNEFRKGKVEFKLGRKKE